MGLFSFFARPHLRGMSYSPVFSFTGHSSSINVLSFSPRGDYLASGGDDHILFVVSCHSGTEVRKLVGTSPITSICWHPEHTAKLFVGYAEGKLVVLDVSAVRLLRLKAALNHAELMARGQEIPQGAAIPLQSQAAVRDITFDVHHDYLAACAGHQIIIWNELTPRTPPRLFRDHAI